METVVFELFWSRIQVVWDSEQSVQNSKLSQPIICNYGMSYSNVDEKKHVDVGYGQRYRADAEGMHLRVASRGGEAWEELRGQSGDDPTQSTMVNRFRSAKNWQNLHF